MGQSAMWSMTTVRSGSFSSSAATSGMRATGASTVMGTLRSKAGLDLVFGKMPPCRIALEVGTHSPWVSRHLAAMGHEVIVANAHKVKLITQSVKKNDRMDAEQLARLARVDPQLLAPIRHRGPEAQGD